MPDVAHEARATDGHHRHDRYAHLPLQRRVRETNATIRIGPKTNSVEKLAELRNAGVNIGAPRFYLGLGAEKLRKLTVPSVQFA